MFAVAFLFLVAHLPFLPRSLEDIDSINFALGLRHFDPALHQPHPPGYPVYIALGRLSLWFVSHLVPSLPQLRAEAVALAVWSLLGGVAAIVAAAALCRAIDDEVETAGRRSPWLPLWTASLLAVSPLFSISGLRPLSDMAGLAITLWAQVAIVRGLRDPRLLILGALLAGLAAGVRVQSAILTLPLLLGALALHTGVDAWRARISAVVAAGSGALTWAVPLLVLSGGLRSYLGALQSQAGEDFAWVDMLWAHPTPRNLALAFFRSFVAPWGEIPLAGLVAVLAAGGVAAALLRTRRALAVFCLAFGPYAVFHLLLQETATIRYALPLMVPVAWLVATAISTTGRLGGVLWAATTASALLVSIPSAIDYGAQEHPAFRAIADMVSEAEGSPPAAVYSHYALYRSLQAASPAGLRVVAPERQREWLEPLTSFRMGETRTLWFLADPLRTDLALFDPISIEVNEQNPWRAAEHLELGGARPVGAVWLRLKPPGWMAGEGWSLTPETGGLVRATGTGLDHRAIEAYVRPRPDPTLLFVGGSYLSPPDAGAAEITLALEGRPVESWIVDPRQAMSFLRFIHLPQVPLPGEAYATLSMVARALEPGKPVPEIAIRQFDLQTVGDKPLMAFGDGWYDGEYQPQTGVRWRWTSARAVLRVASARSIVLALRGESPLKYVKSAPTVRISAGGRTLATYHPSNDFTWRIVVPSDVIAESDGVITIETDQIYLPGSAEGSADTRRLGLRIFESRAELQ